MMRRNTEVDHGRAGRACPSSAFIPERFARRIDVHLLGNYAQLESYPLIMCIVGEPGMGKTWQLRRYLEDLKIEVYSVDASMLEDELAGKPAKYLKQTYIEAGLSNKGPKRSAMVIDDFDTTVGEWEQNTGTVNHQAILAFLMHIAEDPSSVDNAKGLARVPIFITANHVEKIYRPLIRFGRADVFHWAPDLEERTEIISRILGIAPEARNVSRELAQRYESQPISFFSHLASTVRIRTLLNGKDACEMGEAIFSERTLSQLKERCDCEVGAVDWLQVAEAIVDESFAGKECDFGNIQGID